MEKNNLFMKKNNLFMKKNSLFKSFIKKFCFVYENNFLFILNYITIQFFYLTMYLLFAMKKNWQINMILL
jgi:hypothetical protein